MLGVVGAYELVRRHAALRGRRGRRGRAASRRPPANMMGVSRLAYSLATNRQIPSAIGRLHPQRSTPWVAITVCGVIAFGLVLTSDLDFLAGTFAFGATLAFAIAHASVIRLRFREATARRPYRMPFSIKVARRLAAAARPARVRRWPWPRGSASCPPRGRALCRRHLAPRRAAAVRDLPARPGQAAAQALHDPGDGAAGARRRDRVRLDARAGLRQPARRRHRGHGRPAGRRGGGRGGGRNRDRGDLRARDPDVAADRRARPGRADRARRSAALRRAKEVGEEYEGVEVAPATARARSIGAGIVEEAKRRGVEAIVLAAEEPTRMRGGALLGGRGGPRDRYVGEMTRYVVEKAPCRVILTAPPAGEDARRARASSPSPDRVPPRVRLDCWMRARGLDRREGHAGRRPRRVDPRRGPGGDRAARARLASSRGRRAAACSPSAPRSRWTR